MQILTNKAHIVMLGSTHSSKLLKKRGGSFIFLRKNKFIACGKTKHHFKVG